MTNSERVNSTEHTHECPICEREYVCTCTDAFKQKICPDCGKGDYSEFVMWATT